MFDCQRQLLSFLYLGRSDDDRFTFSGKKVEKLSLKRAPCKGISIKTSFARAGENNVSSHMPSFLFHLAGNGCFRQKQVFCFSKEVYGFGKGVSCLVF